MCAVAVYTRLEKGTLDQAFAYFEEAVRLEPEYAPALTGLASVSAMRFTYTTNPAVLDAAIDYARRAIDADPTRAEPHIWMQYALWRQGKLSEAIGEHQTARALDPTLPLTYYFAAPLYVLCNHEHEEVVALLQRAIVPRLQTRPPGIFSAACT